jgi:integrase
MHLSSRTAAKKCSFSSNAPKTSTAFTKPVDPIVGKMIFAWEKVRPIGVKLPDWKTGEAVDFLFLFRLTVVGKSYLNNVLIPTLCRKAGVPTADVRGNIASHRGRSTIASQLFNSKEPMTLELQEWLGHSTPTATQYYAKITPTKLAKSYADAGYFKRNLRNRSARRPGCCPQRTCGERTEEILRPRARLLHV